MARKFLLSLTRNQQLPFDYNIDYETAMDSLGGNSGNNIFQYSLQSMLRANDIDVEKIRWENMTPAKADFINRNYRSIVVAPANLLSRARAADGSLARWTKLVRCFRIPVHIVGLGAQADYDYPLDFLSGCRKQVSDFVSAVLDTGGKIGLRGYFTQEVLHKLGFKNENCEVIGCPSLFIKGGSLQVDKPDLAAERLVPMINGNPVWNHPQIRSYFQDYPQACFVDQDKFFRLLYYPDELGRKDLKFVARKDNVWLDMYEAGRLKFYGDYGSWVEGLRGLKVNFSFGSRIHGNILPILQNIPAYIVATDSRVRELAEYFEIPFEKLPQDLPPLYEFYQKADYGAFNRNFRKKFEKFSSFMASCGLKLETSSPLPAPQTNIWEIPAAARESMIRQAKICRSSRSAYGLYVLYKFFRRCLRGEFRF